ncbi:penicillin-binding protein 1C [Rhodocaloribacter litoris]|uniref:penicillin-binding protein 1C n=1 Tax=Rhodocaloribacter litoris TaxID=2558931 RepID=UPI00141EA2E0|nr:penicillin-binding protein 1C [Rhodocaloribacter litoris]QXD15424.1 penicillin-binding protein 1C [Rhodocaloribacter litoris]
MKDRFSAFPARIRRRALRWLLGGLVLCLGGSLLWPPPVTHPRAVPSASLQVTDRTGGLLRELRPWGRSRPVALDDVSPHVVPALLAAEDRRFYRHVGIDPAAVLRAAWANLRAGRIVSGASTLTMQVARLLRTRHGRSWTGKLAEAHLALRLELYLTKDEILTLWLNRAPFGNGATGIEAAAQTYFAKPARDLTPAEAAYLVGLPQRPSELDPFRHPDRARARQRYVLQAMEREGLLTAEERRRLSALPVGLVTPQERFRAPHLVEHLAHTATGDVVEIRTTIDPQLQATVEALARGHLGRLGTLGVGNAAAVVLDNRTGDVLAYLGSVDFWDERAGGQNDGVRMLRQPGSALKPFTYALALASGRYTPASILPDIETPILEAGGAFTPENYDERYHGPVPLRQALACSYNVPAVRLARELGPPALLDLLHAAGFTSLDRPPEHYGVGLTLGNGEVRLIELARAYAGLARGGSLPPLRYEHWRRTAAGDTLRPATPPPVPVGLAPRIVFLITDILADPEARAPAFGRGGPLELPFPCAVKTGTSKDYRDNWAVGYTPRHTVAVWAGNFDGRPMRWVSGVTGAGALLKAIFLALGDGGNFTPPPDLVRGTVCPHSGARPARACPTRRTEWFVEGTVPQDTCRVHRRVRLDRRTGLLADAGTPPGDVEEKLFTVYPPLFHPWMRANHLPFPPRITAAERPTADTTLHYSDRLLIQYPEDGTVYQLDPVLRPAFQQLHLRGATEPGLLDVHWRIDGRRLPGDYRTASWPLTPGRHTVELHAVTPEGLRLRSRTARITVFSYLEATTSR